MGFKLGKIVKAVVKPIAKVAAPVAGAALSGMTLGIIPANIFNKKKNGTPGEAPPETVLGESFKNIAGPDAAPLPLPVDTAAAEEARRKSLLAQRARGGRLSTLLSDRTY